MPDAVISVEAKLTDYISQELEKIERGFRDTSTAADKTADSVSKYERRLREATDPTNQLYKAATHLVTQYVSIQAAITAVTRAISGMNRLIGESIDLYAKMHPSDEHVRKLTEIESRWKGLKETIGASTIGMRTAWRELTAQIVSAIFRIEEFNGAVAKAYARAGGDTSAVSARIQELYRELDKLERLEKKLVLEGEKTSYIAPETGEVIETVETLSFTSEKYKKLAAEIARVREEIEKLEHVRDKERRTREQEERWAREAEERERRREAEAAERRAREQEERREREENERAYHRMMARIAEWREEREREAQAYIDSIHEMMDAELEYMQLTEELTKLRQKLAEVDKEIMREKVSAFSSMIGAVSTVASAYIEDERDRTMTLAILASAQTLADLISLAASDSTSWYEALAKAIVSVAEVAAIWAPIISDINSAAYGTQFVTSGPALLRVGDNPTQREIVTVTPVGSTNLRGPDDTQQQIVEHYHFYGVSEDRILDGLRSLKRRGRLQEVLA